MQESIGTLSLIPKPVLLCLLVFTMHNLNGELPQIAFYLKIKCTFCRLEVLLIDLTQNFGALLRSCSVRTTEQLVNGCKDIWVPD